MGLVFAAIAPHGGDVIAEIADDPAQMAATRAAMEELGRRCAAARPDTVVVLTPHGLIVKDAVSVGVNSAASGFLTGRGRRRVSATFETDADLVVDILREAQPQRVPVAPVRMNDPKGENDSFPLDWGALVPLWFLARPVHPDPKVVVMAPDRSLSRETLVRCGVVLARAAEASGNRVALIASCDQGHAHDPEGPYGYDPASAEHDTEMVAAIAEDDLPRLLEWPESFLESAKVDAFWQTLILMGALGHTPMAPDLLSYEVPTYFGMIVAAYIPTDMHDVWT